MDYREALRFVLSFTDFERLPQSYWSREFDLRRVEELLGRLDNPHLTSKSVLVAGSKGKGSTASMIASALQAEGHTTGLYTSPHLHTFRERVRVDGELISEEELARVVEQLRPEVEAVNLRRAYGELTTFEILTALAFTYFRDRSVDYQVLEVGLGGRLDATNVVTPEVAVITSISMDHAEVLGDSLAKIAREKAGIVKAGVPVVVSPQRCEAGEVIEEVCREKGARLVSVGRDVTWERLSSDMNGQTFDVAGRLGRYRLTIPLLGDHQLENASAAVGALEVLGVAPEHIVAGLARVKWPGRLEVLRERPLFLVDGAHNDDSAMRLKNAIERHLSFDHLILILGVSSDKNMPGIVKELAPVCSLVIATRSRHARALEPSVLVAEVEKHGVEASVADSVSSAVERALRDAGPGDLICATGSLFVVAEARERVMNIAGEVYA
ncbi:MAG: folylpolyglutamate synthase/dihydrofolate synthase family protein [Chloroflexota bacterium]|nr:folylpolyglutamate synthase/dihydrofolate synthase family protein [Chloroflexota bacterium]